MNAPTKFPPVNTNPSFDDCFRSARFSDYLQVGGVTMGSWGFGFIRGKPARFVMAGLMATVGFTFGTMLVVQNTRGRLMGYRENTREIRKYGLVSEREEEEGPMLTWKDI